MKLYFKESKDEQTLIAKPKTEEDAKKIVYEFCENRHFEVRYLKSWRISEEMIVLDIGSCNKIFLLSDKD